MGKKSDSPDEDKCAHDSKLLIPTLKDFFTKHPLINPNVFLGDAAFDTLTIYKDLLIGDTFGKARRFSCAYIPLNKHTSLEDTVSFINANGFPCCPNDPSLLLKKEGNNTAFLKNGVAGRRTQNEKTLHADLILAGITQLITVVLADKIKHHEFNAMLIFKKFYDMGFHSCL